MSFFLNIKDIENLCYDYAKTHFGKYEPIPPFNDRYPEKLETALAITSREIGGVLMYKSLYEQAAVLFYEMIKLHPFVNGNKRIAFVSLVFFLFLNGVFLDADNVILYKKSKKVADSDPKSRKEIVAMLLKFIANNSTPFDLAKTLHEYRNNIIRSKKKAV
ncbi:MAG: type II toxin-antitoxin system death-on-curing family toxin [Patescibacteria group bacterium]|nr:type II toxin-antitoxin system death-on-curing family toxin [Patescibacteria group bacterium]